MLKQSRKKQGLHHGKKQEARHVRIFSSTMPYLVTQQKVRLADPGRHHLKKQHEAEHGECLPS